MDIKKEFEEMVKWGVKNEKNKKQVISMSLKLIGILNKSSGQELSPEELDKLIGGAMEPPLF